MISNDPMKVVSGIRHQQSDSEGGKRSWNLSKWMFPKIGGNPQNGLFIMENPIKMDDLRVPLFLETPKSTFVHLLTLVDWFQTRQSRGHSAQSTGHLLIRLVCCRRK